METRLTLLYSMYSLLKNKQINNNNFFPKMPHKASVLHYNYFLFFVCLCGYSLVKLIHVLNVLMFFSSRCSLIFQFFRTVASTNMNDVSSCSHAIFTILFTQVGFLVTVWWNHDHSTRPGLLVLSLTPDL